MFGRGREFRGVRERTGMLIDHTAFRRDVERFMGVAT
jgi:hypothetical protein